MRIPHRQGRAHHSSFVTPPFGLTDPQFFDARADGSELFLDRSLECLRLLA
jgi:hypothetical protein